MALPLVVLAAASSVGAALRVEEAAWLWWLAAALFLGVIATHLFLARRLAHRVELLAGPAEDR